MTHNIIIQKAIEEIETRNLALTEQYLQIHEVLYANEKPKVARVGTEKKDGAAIVYFPVKDEEFYLAVHVQTKPVVAVIFVDMLPYLHICLRATSDNLNFNQLAAFTKLKPSSGWNKGDLKKSGKSAYKFSAINFRPNPEPDEFEDKIKKLLDFLEEDITGIRNLASSTETFIYAGVHFHYGNGLLGGFALDKRIIQRISNLSLQIDFDLSVAGNPIQ